MNKATTILDQYDLRKTKCREDVLHFFISHAELALSQQEIFYHLQQHYDRATLYRTLKSFDEKGMIHRVNLAGSETKYALDQAVLKDNDRFDSHIHFQCAKCEKTVCLSDFPIYEPSLPTGYEKIKSEFLITGICKECNKMD